MSRSPRLMIMAGGTGGHVFPALAVAKLLQSEGTEVTWLGTRRGLEARVIPASNIAMEWVSVEGLRGRSKASLLLAPFKLLRAMWQSAGAIRRVQPDCILGMGGFVSGPGGLVARLLGQPLVIHEQNAVAGLTNKYLARLANKVLTGFPSVQELPVGAKWVGNPVRAEIVPGHNSTDGVNVLVIGGSQGAHSFNVKLPAVFKQLSTADLSIWHQSGRDKADEVTAGYKSLGLNAKVSEFIEDMAEAYRWADILICRAGAMTIAECAAAAKPALLIPFPYSAGDHQIKNAQAMVDVGGAKMLMNDQLDQAVTVETLSSLLADKDQLKAMGQRAHGLHKPYALVDVAAECREYLNA